MVGTMSLDGTWKLRGIDGRRGGVASYCMEGADERTCIDAQVPGEVHLDLMRCGQIDDPRWGTNALRARWVEEQFWIYHRTFTVPPEALEAERVWLVFEGLDHFAEIYLNNTLVGTHTNIFYPCRVDVTDVLREGENYLAISLDGGLHWAGDRPGKEYDPRHSDGPMHKRMWLRKPQYQFGWDWNPRLINVGIFRPVRLEWADSVRIDQITVYPELADDHKSATVNARLHLENVTDRAMHATLTLEVTSPDGDALPVAEETVVLEPGISTQSLAVTVQNPDLWWPRPYGGQPLYGVTCRVQVGDREVDRRQCRTGIRSVRINQDPHPQEGNYFIIEINGTPIFAKGGNWVPADMIYADVDVERYRKLIDLAVEANFNTLRVWGGGLYLDHDFLNLCDEAGIIIWHDFIFACAQYPSGDPQFLRDVRREVTYITRELSPHPSLVIWCGNNEIEMGAWDWDYDTMHAHPDYALYHMEIPRIVSIEDPSRPYWPSSPYSPDYSDPNSPIIGDQHPWHVSLGENRANFWAYRTDVSRFPNEGGALGASSPATLRQFLPENEQYYLSPSWEYHDNEMVTRSHMLLNEEWFDRWLGLNPGDMSLDDYAYYSGLLQAEALVEYSNNFRRRMFSTSSAIFWMYNDSWPVTHGWTIVDYYFRRKVAYHPVRRAFDPIQIIPSLDGDQVTVYGVNDTLSAWRGEARYGLACFDGGRKLEEVVSVDLAPNSATVIGRIPLAEWQMLGYRKAAAYATLWQDGYAVRQNRLLMAAYKEIDWPEARVRVERQGDYAVFNSDVFCWGVCLDLDGEADLADDLFDLLPGIPWSMPWPQDRPLPTVSRVANYRLP
jgi:beta-mannosidase